MKKVFAGSQRTPLDVMVVAHGGTKQWMKVSGGGTDSPMATSFYRGKWGYKTPISPDLSGCTPICTPHFTLAGHGRLWTATDVKSLIHQRKRASTGLVWTPLDGVMVLASTQRSAVSRMNTSFPHFKFFAVPPVVPPPRMPYPQNQHGTGQASVLSLPVRNIKNRASPRTNALPKIRALGLVAPNLT